MNNMTVHCSIMDSDTAHIDNEVESSAKEDGHTIYDQYIRNIYEH